MMSVYEIVLMNRNTGAEMVVNLEASDLASAQERAFEEAPGPDDWFVISRVRLGRAEQ